MSGVAEEASAGVGRGLGAWDAIGARRTVLFEYAAAGGCGRTTWRIESGSLSPGSESQGEEEFPRRPLT